MRGVRLGRRAKENLSGKYPPPQVFQTAQIKVHQGSTILLSKTLFAVELSMDMNQRQIALSLLETLREDLIYAHLNNGSRILDVAQGRNSARVIVNKSGESESKKTEAGRCAQCPEF